MSDCPKRPCRHAGCPELVDRGYCEKHKRPNYTESQKRYDKRRGTTSERGYDGRWQRIRLQALQRDCYLCRPCYREGRTTVAVDVDHIIPIKAAPDKRLELSNLQSICRECHNKKTSIESTNTLLRQRRHSDLQL